MPGLLKCVRSDSGGEFCSKEFAKLLIDNKIRHETSCPYSPHQNGKAERAWRTIFEMARCLLLESGLPKFMWSYAVMTACYIRNRCLNKAIGKTPYEIVSKKKPNLQNMHIFGQTCYALIQNPKKLDDRSMKGIFVGYDKCSPAYLIYFPNKNVVKRVRVVKFIDQNITNQNTESYQSSDDDEDFITNEKQNVSDPKNVNDVDNLTEDLPISHENKQNNDKRPRRKPKYLDEYIVDVVDDTIDDVVTTTIHKIYSVGLDVPKTYQEATSCIDSKKWEIAMNEEMQALRENGTFQLVIPPPDRNIIGGRWVYALKTGQNDTIQYKARYVARGFSQLPDIDYQETFAPTARMTSIRTLIQIAVQNDMIIHQMDVRTAYLNAPIDRDIFVEQPLGYEVKGENDDILVFKLQKSLYGLKQSGRNWNDTLNTHLCDLGFNKSKNDPCIYMKKSVFHDSFVYILTNVDDILVLACNESELMQTKTSLKDKFKMKDLGQINYYLGIEFYVEHDSISMCQSKYVMSILHTFGMTDCKPRHTPCEMNINKLPNDVLDDNEHKIYRQIVGALIYLMTCTRPDIAFVVTNLSQFMSKPTSGHMIMAKHVLRFLKGTIYHKLIFIKSENSLSIDGWCDADWASSHDRKSISGYCFYLFNKSPLISWKSRKQPTVALSTCEAEYMALVSAIQEGIYLISLINEIQQTNLQFFSLRCDNTSAIALGNNPVQHQRTKHIDIKYHFIRQHIQKGSVDLSYVQSECNLADVFTKPVGGIRYQKFLPALMGS